MSASLRPAARAIHASTSPSKTRIRTWYRMKSVVQLPSVRTLMSDGAERGFTLLEMVCVLGLIAIEGAALALTVAAALYLRQNFATWPPQGTPGCQADNGHQTLLESEACRVVRCYSAGGGAPHARARRLPMAHCRLRPDLCQALGHDFVTALAPGRPPERHRRSEQRHMGRHTGVTRVISLACSVTPRLQDVTRICDPP